MNSGTEKGYEMVTTPLDDTISDNLDEHNTQQKHSEEIEEIIDASHSSQPLRHKRDLVAGNMSSEDKGDPEIKADGPEKFRQGRDT